MQEEGPERKKIRMKPKKDRNSNEQRLFAHEPRAPRLRVLGMIWIVVIFTAVLGLFAIFGWIVSFPEHPPDGHVFH